jgi:hypothetical protein
MKCIIAIALLAFYHISYSQIDFQENLNGFKLGQFKDSPKNHYGNPIVSDKFDDGFEYEIFNLRPDTSLYMIFEYSPDDLNIIWSIQIYGNDHDPNFKGLKLGMPKSEVQEIIGNPINIIDVGEYGEKWEYDSSNYSFEINTSGILASIKITDESYKYFTEIDITKMVSLEKLQTILKSKDRTQLSKILAPDIELYIDDSLYYFNKSFEEEMLNDESSIFSLIFKYSNDLLNISVGDTLEYEENMRLMMGVNPMSVIKFNDNHKIREIVYKYQFGRYVIWEMPIIQN